MNFEKEVKKLKNYCITGLEFAREILYPRRCPVCREIVIPKGKKICLPCMDRLTYITEPCCKKCGKQLYTDEQEYCHDCKKKEFLFEYGMAVFSYDSYMQRSVADFKFHGRKENADFYAEEIVRLYGKEILRIAPDVIIPVPVHEKKLKQRGFNQSHIISEKISKMLDIEENSEYLIRIKNTLPQKQLNDTERIKNLENAFAINQRLKSFSKYYKKILLVDDIYTTGSTMQECSNILLGAGAEKIYFICLCIGSGFN